MYDEPRKDRGFTFLFFADELARILAGGRKMVEAGGLQRILLIGMNFYENYT